MCGKYFVGPASLIKERGDITNKDKLRCVYRSTLRENAFLWALKLK